MKVRFDSSKERRPMHEQGVKVLYGSSKRVAFRLRWYLILFLVLSPLMWFAGNMAYGAFVVHAPAQLLLPIIEVRARDAAQISRLAVRDGDQVKKGQLLVQMDNPEWRRRLDQLNAMSMPSESSSSAVSARLKNVLRRELGRAQQRLSLAESLLKDGAATHAEVLSAATERDRAQADLFSFEQQQYQQREQPGVVRDIALREAEAKSLQDRLQALRVVAHEPATVVDVLVNEGENVGPGTLLMRLERPVKPSIMVYLQPADAKYGQTGQPLEIGLPDGTWLDARVQDSADRTRRLPDELREPFSAAQSGLLVSVAVDGEFPKRWLVDHLTLKARFPHNLPHLLAWWDDVRNAVVVADSNLRHYSAF
ncbi:MAG: biotin/lipoyl-binding protein [Burkholderiaceae bacterium]|nr:MAG: biotin/lipoyl-binding protein [Burkholderiaceae bacterium]TAM01857.1 MAG: biotin/lipoyl-binding protein [Pusillimonas sp.]